MSANETTTEFLERTAKMDLLRFTTAGSVDDGKSTLIGRLLHDCKSIYEDQLSALKKDSAKVGTGPEIDYALLTDGLKAEREQGITIDVAYRYFSTPKRHFIIADTPGHEQYTRNMATGASTANVAIILIDARHGVLTQTKRHSFIASLLGIPRLLICVNKMDLVDYAQEVFDNISVDYQEFVARLSGVVDLKFVPISALEGDNVVDSSERTPWYHGETVLEYLETIYIGSDRNLVDLRFPVQYVQRPNLDFRGYAGQISSGVIRKGDAITVLPSGKKSRVTSIVTFDGELEYAFAPMSVTVTLEDEIDISRGDMLCHARNLPHVQQDFEAMVVWMSEEPLDPDRIYTIKHTTRMVKARIQKVHYRVDVNTLHRDETNALELNEIGRVAFRANQKLFVDAYKKNKWTGSFILVDPYSNNTVAAGMIIDRVPAEQLGAEQDAAAEPKSQNIRRETSGVLVEERQRLLGQRALTLWFTGLSGSGKSSISREVERRLHEQGKLVFTIDGDNMRFGLNRDLSFSAEDRTENIRRAGEVAKLLNDAGIIVLVAFISPFEDDRDSARKVIGDDRFYEIHVDTPLEVCEARDTKGLYKKARAGEIEEFTGISSPYEPPKNPELRVKTAEQPLEECVSEVLAGVERLIQL
mgnify:CR=1 FL=1